jgi:hypothetical protein
LKLGFDSKEIAMKIQRNDTWVAVGITGFCILYHIVTLFITYISMRQISTGAFVSTSKWRFGFWSILYITVLIVNFFGYYLLRSKQLRKLFVKIHLVCLLLIFVFNPILFSLIVRILSNYFSFEELAKKIILIGRIKAWVSLFLLVGSQVFYFFAISGTYKSTAVDQSVVQPDSVDYLSDFFKNNRP